MLKKILAFALTASMLVALAGCYNSSSSSTPAPADAAAEPAAADNNDDNDEAEENSNAATGDPIQIGAIYPLTGDVAAIGQNIVKGVDFAVEEINSLGGINGQPIEIIYGDSEGDPKVGMSVAEKLITQDNVVALLGCYQSAVTEVVSQTAERYQIPMLTAISTADALTTHGYEYFFRLAPTNSMMLRTMIDYRVYIDSDTDTEVKNIAIVADNTLLGQETAKWARYWAEERGIEVLGEVLYTQGAADLSSEVLTLKQMNPDALVADCYISDGILLTKTMSEQDYKPEVMVGKATAFIDPTFIPNTGDIANGISTCLEWSPDLTKGQEVNAGFRAEYGIDMNGHSAQSYTAVWILKTAIEQAGSTEADAVRDAMKNLKIEDSFPGGNEIILPYDVISFDNIELEGDAHTNTNNNAVVAVAQIQNGELRCVWPDEYAAVEAVVPAAFS